jgi:hypothetical protein
MTLPEETAPATVAGHVAALLAALGASHPAVAEALSAAGITGYPESTSCCPIAAYLLRGDARILGLAVSEDEISIDLPGGTAYVGVPAPVAAFITAFDTGSYPHLNAYHASPRRGVHP